MNRGHRLRAPRILLYGHDSYGLGHYRRNLSIGSGLSREFPEGSILCLTGSPCSDSFCRPERFDCVRLPAVTKNGRGEYTSRSLLLSIDQITEIRRGIILETVRRFRPDLFLVDHSPLGMNGELRDAISTLKEESPHASIVLGLRDIIDEETRVVESWHEQKIYSVLEKDFDRILVYGDREVYDVADRYSFPQELREKVVYTGYIYRNGSIGASSPIRSRLAPRTGRLVAVTVGGGGDGEELIRLFLRSLDEGSYGNTFESVVVAGPLMDKGTRRSLTAKAEASHLPVSFVDFDPQVLDIFAASEVIVSMGGYNSLSEILALGKRCVAFPRAFPRIEQFIRARRFAELGLLSCVDPAEATPEGLRKALDRELGIASKLKEPALPRLNFGGLSRTVQELRRCMERSLSSRCALGSSSEEAES